MSTESQPRKMPLYRKLLLGILALAFAILFWRVTLVLLAVVIVCGALLALLTGGQFPNRTSRPKDDGPPDAPVYASRKPPPTTRGGSATLDRPTDRN
jgi:hypothetical protein